MGMCPECGGNIIRQIFPRFSMCSNQCGILLDIPSWRESEKAVSAVRFQIGDGPEQKMTWEHYLSLNEAVKIFCSKYCCGGDGERELFEKPPTEIEISKNYLLGELYKTVKRFCASR